MSRGVYAQYAHARVMSIVRRVTAEARVDVAALVAAAGAVPVTEPAEFQLALEVCRLQVR